MFGIRAFLTQLERARKPLAPIRWRFQLAREEGKFTARMVMVEHGRPLLG